MVLLLGFCFFVLIYFAPFSKVVPKAKIQLKVRLKLACWYEQKEQFTSIRLYKILRKRGSQIPKHQEAIHKLTFSSFPLFCWSFFSRPRTAFPLSLGFREDGRWGPLTAALIRLLWPRQSLYWADWRFLGPGEGLISCNTCKKPQCKTTSEH